MNEIICPHCQKAFKIDEAGYADILKQVRDQEFNQQLEKRLELAEQEKQAALELAEVAQKLAVTEAVSAVEKERDALAMEFEQTKQDKIAASELAETKLSNELQKVAARKDTEIQRLSAELAAF